MAKIGNDKSAFSSLVPGNGRFDEFRNNLVPARNADPVIWRAFGTQ
jgi:hypothetical protein